MVGIFLKSFIELQYDDFGFHRILVATKSACRFHI